MEWYRVAYNSHNDRRWRLILAVSEQEAIAKVKIFVPDASLFEATIIPQGTRTK